MDSLTPFFSWIALHWLITTIGLVCAVAIAAMCKRGLETHGAQVQRAQAKRKQELRALADKISTYGRNIHQRYPTGDVVVSEHDLADELRKRPDTVATALKLLLGEQKVQKGPLSGYWKLNV
jgi:uncharacterized membrane-anchored protein YhcB (DUF1043 family)